MSFLMQKKTEIISKFGVQKFELNITLTARPHIRYFYCDKTNILFIIKYSDKALAWNTSRSAVLLFYSPARGTKPTLCLGPLKLNTKFANSLNCKVGKTLFARNSSSIHRAAIISRSLFLIPYTRYYVHVTRIYWLITFTYKSQLTEIQDEPSFFFRRLLDGERFHFSDILGFC